MYTDLAFNRKVQQLSEADQRRYVMLLCLHSAGRFEGATAADMAFDLRISRDDMEASLQRLRDARLIEEDGTIHGWGERQFVSDISTERNRKWREKVRTRDGDATSPRRRGGVSATPSESDSESESDTDSETDTHSEARACPSRCASPEEDPDRASATRSKRKTQTPTTASPESCAPQTGSQGPSGASEAADQLAVFRICIDPGSATRIDRAAWASDLQTLEDFGHKWTVVQRVMDWAFNDSDFWAGRIITAKDFVRHYEKMHAQWSVNQKRPSNTKKEETDMADSQRLRPIFANLEFEFNDGGEEDARLYLEKQDPKLKPDLRRLLDRLIADSKGAVR
jgi:hypothetical protein